MVEYRARRFAAVAKEAARWPKGELATSLMHGNCWQAAIEVARRSGAIGPDAASDLNARAIPNDPDRFIIPNGERVETAAEMKKLEAGQFLVFVRTAGDRVLSHVMVSLGDGEAAGSNNGGIGGPGHWAKMNIAAPKQLVASAAPAAWGVNGFRFGDISFEVYACPLDAIEGATRLLKKRPPRGA